MGKGGGRRLLWDAARVGRAKERWCKVEGGEEIRGGVEIGDGSCRESFQGGKGNFSVHHRLRAYGVYHWMTWYMMHCIRDNAS